MLVLTDFYEPEDVFLIRSRVHINSPSPSLSSVLEMVSNWLRYGK